MSGRFQTKVTELQKVDNRTRAISQEMGDKDATILDLQQAITSARQTISQQTQAISQQAAVIQQQAAAMTALQNRLTVEEQATNADAIRLGAIEASYLKRFMLPDWTVVIAQGVTLALAAGNRTYALTLAASFGVKAGAPIFATPKGSVAAGYIVGAASAPADNRLEIQIGNPLIAIGGSMSIVLSVFTLRP